MHCAVEDLPRADDPPAAAILVRRYQRREQRPFLVGQATWWRGGSPSYRQRFSVVHIGHLTHHRHGWRHERFKPFEPEPISDSNESHAFRTDTPELK
jgi:hypothetical protein